MPDRRLLLVLLAAAGCTASRPDAVDVPAVAARPAEAVAPVVRLVAGRADTLVVADLLGPGVVPLVHRAGRRRARGRRRVV